MLFTIKDRMQKAVSLGVEFFGGWKVLVIGSIPAVFRLIQRFTRLGDVLSLCLAYAVVAISVFVWKLIAAGPLIEEEKAKLAVLDSLSQDEKKSLHQLVLSVKQPAGPNIWHSIENKTKFIQRDVCEKWAARESTPEFAAWVGAHPESIG